MRSGYITDAKEYELALDLMSEKKKNRDIIDIEYFLSLQNKKLTVYVLSRLEKIQAYNAKIYRERYGK